MLCEKCKKKKATFYYNENIGGDRRSFHLCADCTAAMEASGELEDLSIAFPQIASPFSLWDDAIFGNMVAAAAQALPSDAPDRTCPVCGLRFKDIATTGKVGCATCYETFAPRLLPVIKSLHGAYDHTGNRPRIYRKRMERQARVAKLREQLKAAVSQEAYEDAALLRDELRRLEKES